MKLIKTVVLVLVSVGWIIPLYLGVDSIISFLRVEVYPRLLGQEPLNSFPFLNFSRNMVIVGFVWLAVIAVFWSATLTRHLIRPCAQQGAQPDAGTGRKVRP